jgi:hypothetical protein
MHGFMPNFITFFTFACMKWKKSHMTEALGKTFVNPSARASSKSRYTLFGSIVALDAVLIV